jgi:hypothetical protein
MNESTALFAGAGELDNEPQMFAPLSKACMAGTSPAMTAH